MQLLRGRFLNRSGKREGTGVMRHNRLGSSDLVVSEISLGTWLSYGQGPDRQRLIACIHRALDLCVNPLDTANV